MFREYPEEIQGDLTYGSVVLIDLEHDTQTRLLSGLDYNYTPRPWRWLDADHVLMYENGDYWILNIQTKEFTQTDKP